MLSSLLFTIGYQKHSIEEIIAILTKNDVFVVIDVREIAWSRKPGFTKFRLGEALAAAEIQYHHAPFAGNPRQLRQEGGTRAEILEQFRVRVEQNPKIVDDLQDLISRWVKPGHAVALMAFDRHPDDCHRGILADALSERYGYYVEHLAPEGCPRAGEKLVAVTA